MIGVKFTEREKLVVNLVNQGCTNREIGAKIDRSRQGISNVLQVIYDKTGMSSRLELALWWEAHRQYYV